MESKTKDKTAKKSKNKEKKINNYIIVEDDVMDITDTDILKSGKTSTNVDINVDLDISDKSAPDDKIILTPEQDKIYEEIINFIKNKNENQLLLVGYAGTGKTTMVTKIINDMLDTRLCKKIVIVAPTHKAVNIAKSKLFDNLGDDEELSLNINIMTVHRLLNYQSYIDSDAKTTKYLLVFLLYPKIMAVLGKEAEENLILK
jgi:superfamily II DNA or RNA helicase